MRPHLRPSSESPSSPPQLFWPYQTTIFWAYTSLEGQGQFLLLLNPNWTDHSAWMAPVSWVLSLTLVLNSYSSSLKQSLYYETNPSLTLWNFLAMVFFSKLLLWPTAHYFAIVREVGELSAMFVADHQLSTRCQADIHTLCRVKEIVSNPSV